MLQKSPDSASQIEGPAPTAPQDDRAAADLSKILNVRGPRNRVWTFAGVAAVILVAVVAVWSLQSSRSASGAVTYVTAPVTRGDLTVTVSATGTLQPTNEVDISSELSGTVATVNVDFNDVVKQGQALATLKTDNLTANVNLAQATLEARQADVATANATIEQTAAAFARAQKLTASGYDTRTTFDSAKADSDRAVASLASAKANLDIAQANLDIAKSNLAKAKIVSPINGVVLSRAVEPGQIVASSLQAPVLFTLAEDLSKMEAQVSVDEADMGKVKVGNTATFTVEAFQNRAFPGKISQVRLSSATVEGVVTYTAILTVDNPDLALRPGMTATATIMVDQVKDTLLVPNAALRYAPAVAATGNGRGAGLLGLLMPSRPPGQGNTTAAPGSSQLAGGKRALWVLRNGEPKRVAVTVGLSDGTNTTVTSDELVAGDKVITAAKKTS
jgi:HlyD family secretion protein